jgi:hypothetical protein
MSLATLAHLICCPRPQLFRPVGGPAADALWDELQRWGKGLKGTTWDGPSIVFGNVGELRVGMISKDSTPPCRCYEIAQQRLKAQSLCELGGDDTCYSYKSRSCIKQRPLIREAYRTFAI